MGSILCAAYLFSVVRVAYFDPAPDENWKDPGLAQKIALIVLASAVVVLGILPDPFLELAGRAAEEFLALKLSDGESCGCFILYWLYQAE